MGVDCVCVCAMAGGGGGGGGSLVMFLTFFLAGWFGLPFTLARRASGVLGRATAHLHVSWALSQARRFYKVSVRPGQ